MSLSIAVQRYLLDPEVILGECLKPMTLQLTNICKITGYGGLSVFMKMYSSLSSRTCAFEYFLKQLEQMYKARPTAKLSIDSTLVFSTFRRRSVLIKFVSKPEITKKKRLHLVSILFLFSIKIMISGKDYCAFLPRA